MSIALTTEGTLAKPFNRKADILPLSRVEGVNLGHFVEAAYAETIQTPNSIIHFTHSAPLFRNSQPASHKYAEVVDRKTGENLIIDVITTGTENSYRGNVKIFVEPEGNRLLDSRKNRDFEKHLNTFQGTTLVVRQAIRIGPNGTEMVTPDELPDTKTTIRSLQAITDSLGYTLKRAQKRSLDRELPNANTFDKPIMELPGGFTVYPPREVIHGETHPLKMFVYPVLMKRINTDGQSVKDYFEVVSLRPLEDLQQEKKLMVGMESLCPCMTSGSRGDDCFAQVDFRIDSSILEGERRGIGGVMVYAHGQTDLGFGEMSRLVVDRTRANTANPTTGFPEMDTEVAREKSGIHTTFNDIRSHDDTAMIIAGLFPRLETAISPTNNADKYHALSQRVHTERIPANHDPSLAHEAIMINAAQRRGKRTLAA